MYSTQIVEHEAGLSAAKRALLANRLRGWSIAHTAPATIPRRGATEAPLSFAQQRLWFLNRLEPGNPFYNLAAALRVSGKLQHRALEQAVNEIVRRHEVLRTSFVEMQDKVVQRIAAQFDIPVPVLDLSGLSEGDREAEAWRLVKEEARKPFDLAQGPLLRASFIALDDQRDVGAGVLVLVLHHVVADGWSFGILTREFVALYEAFSQGKPSPLPDLQLQYADYAIWQRSLLTEDFLQGSA